MTETATDTPAEPDKPAPPPAGGIKRKTLITIGIVTAVVWAFAINTGSTVLISIVGGLTGVLAVLLLLGFRAIRKQRRMISLMQGATTSEARRDAIAELSEGKDASSPIKLFARAQLLAADDPKGALELLQSVELRVFPGAMQDDVSLLKVQLYLGFGRTQEARKCADSMNLDNPARKEIRALAASVVAEAWARTGKPKQALALLDTIEEPKEHAEQIKIQSRVARVFARFAANQRAAARTELAALAELDVNLLGRFLSPQYRVHPELQKLARAVLEQNPAARKLAKAHASKAGKRG